MFWPIIRGRHTVGNAAGQRQSLQNTHGSGGTLDNTCEDRADQHAQKGIAEGHQQVRELGHIGQRADGIAHQAHAEHQNGKAQEDCPDVLLPGIFGHHTKMIPTKAKIKEKFSGLSRFSQKLSDSMPIKGQKPGSQRSADVGPHNDANGLPQFHNAGVDQTYQHNGHSRGRLNGNGNTGTQ